MKHILMPKYLDDPLMIDVLYPDTVDELDAQGENQMLKGNELAKVLPTDDHETHIYNHLKVMPKTQAVWFHIAIHKYYLAQQKAMEQQQMQMQMQQAQSKSQANTPEGTNPNEAVAPLKGEIKNNKQLTQ